ncbi:MAG TPA: hypothetical protein VIY68_11760 [Steroidobacteraceae bacterium]
MKPIAAALLIPASILVIHFALGATRPDPPAGVDAQHWIPVSDKMGFVVTMSEGYPGALVTTDRQPLLLAPPAEGYFMVHTGNTWQRLVIQDPLKGPGSSG